MKKLILSLTFLLCAAFATDAQNQKLMIGEKAPEIKVSRWLSSSGGDQNPKLLEFVYTKSQPSVKRLAELSVTATKYKGKLTVIAISKDDAESVTSVVDVGKANYRIALDDAGKTFSAYGVSYVPFAVLIDSKGRTVWSGNPSSLTDDIINKAIN